ncbi:SDR family oxidoreductase [Sphingobium sp. 10 DY56-G10]|nr:NAD-dependent epimerase/dehydratase:Short-chain dehydrogenase/reductase SDR [Sphingomonas sp. SKA58]MBA38828.1 NAD(P)-dependent oxidoreductase [Sphingobium sp.]MBS48674.1 NAD(P)-dependent oxidoreductase [Sphingobium sp.]MCC4256071.1 SDR family oxidoreductase [Sphingobium lactosutens]HCW61176.1 SDR family NAD(P)-dependent oxidoreductase [Sphingobium sp.]
MIGDRLKGKVAVITGGASGIGQACAVRFAEEGADIVVADLQPGDATVRLVEELGRKAIAVKVDTTSEADCDNMIAEAVRQFGHVDVGVMCAGVASFPEDEREGVDPHDSGHVIHVTTAKFQKVIDINVTGVMLSARALARQLLKQGTGGSIVNIASTAGRIPVAGASAYCVSKAGVIMLTKVMALELAQTGIRINAVGPGFTTTPMWDVPQDSDAYRWAMSITPMNRNGTPREQADACLYLACDESSFMTGQTLHPAGGQFTG